MRSDRTADTMISTVIRATVTTTLALTGLAALAAAVITSLAGEAHWSVTWLVIVVCSVLAMGLLGHATRLDALAETIRQRLRTDVDAWRASEPDPIDVGDHVRHVVSGRRGVVDELEHRHGTDGAWVALDGDAEAHWVPLAVLRHAPATDNEES